MFSEVVKLNGTQIYNQIFASNFTLMFDILSSISVTFSFIFLIIIILKTPKSMKRFKYFLISYSSASLLTQLIIAFCPLMALHPCVWFYPLGIGQSFNIDIRLILYGFAIFGLLLTADSIIAMVWERYYALKGNGNPNIPLYLYFIMISNSLCFLVGIFCIIFIKPLFHFVLIPPEEIKIYISYYVVNLEEVLISEKLFILRYVSKNSFPFFGFVMFLFGLFKLLIIIIGIFLNFIKSRKVESENQMSPQTLKLNQIFRRILYIQFSGYCFFIGIPVCLGIYIYLFIEEPTITVNYLILIFFSVELYDAIFTCIFIKPYREALFYPIYFIMKWKAKPPTIISIIFNSTAE